jgi:hypothetical protein
MKRNRPLSLYNSDDPAKSRQQESTDPLSQNKTAYLKPIHPVSAPENDSPPANPDRLAALRYIKESAFLKKLYIGKMSC